MGYKIKNKNFSLNLTGNIDRLRFGQESTLLILFSKFDAKF